MAILVLTSAETGSMIATTSEQKSYDEDGFYRMFFREPAVGVSRSDGRCGSGSRVGFANGNK